MANRVKADGSINALGEIVLMVIVVSTLGLLLLAGLMSLVLNFSVFKNRKHFFGTGLGALVLSSVPVLLHGFGDYTIFFFVNVIFGCLIGGVLGNFIGIGVKNQRN